MSPSDGDRRAVGSVAPRYPGRLDFDAVEVAADPGLRIVAYTAPSGSAARRALTRLSQTANDDNDAHGLRQMEHALMVAG
jgi:hypothetical protein